MLPFTEVELGSLKPYTAKSLEKQISDLSNDVATFREDVAIVNAGYATTGISVASLEKQLGHLAHLARRLTRCVNILTVGLTITLATGFLLKQACWENEPDVL